MIKMNQFLFKNESLNLIIEGKKTQTIRFWKQKRKIKIGDLVEATNFRKKIILKITDIYQKPLSELTDEEAKLDGFKNKKMLFEAIEHIYGSSKIETLATIIRFIPQIQNDKF